MPVAQSVLPYDYDALEPHVSKRTLEIHYDRHHRAYVDKLNALIEGTDYDDLSLEQVIDKARLDGDVGILNNALQAWNHGFLWQSMSPGGSDRPEGAIMNLIESEFGSLDGFFERFREAALGQFGSGWVWVVLEAGKLRVTTTGNADSPVGTHQLPLLTLDVWEHAYYLDFQNERARYVDTFLTKLVNWDFAAAQLSMSDQLLAA
ncbi:MAG: superoxide dismutase [Pseudomonadota bacterium]